ncbi:proton-conducting transporter membrane subunit [Myxococcus xanthus]|uniref:NADH/ubiquinone/plastoquinone n=1 Tax=Myxococcus xanthus TaxID=34 RepID=A0AAE6G121_MYXXA|nr:proton-conducting transporter membrane subunit [Myxococcus xanthus]QDE68913.1 NADH/ubiquinone/plastoquinone [Myxococcus xanthus]QDE76189.1 NADH/ubiquinone/plastoquinone [Myxococcus xanthus]QDE83611.1 NADH/ubiquinone/plastoquinone [Myxococcus xanthus]QDF05415.1 NADH/ubiquinone/plastoquinone [Myxococcus xanthus]
MTHSVLLSLPMILCLGAAATGLLAPSRAWPRRWLALMTMVSLAVVGAMLLVTVRREGIQSMQVGGWAAPFGITLVADLLSALLVLVTGVMGLTVVSYSAATLPASKEAGAYYPLVLVLVGGVCGAFLTGDLFNLFVWIEVMLGASFVLLALEARQEQLEASIKYMSLSLMGSVVLLCAVGLLYGAAGTLNLADLAVTVPGLDTPNLMTVVSMFFLVAFALKAGAFPLFFWLPASYHTPPAAVTTLFSALLTKVGVYALARVFTLVFTQDPQLTSTLLLVMGGLTMVTGVLGAVAQYDMRRLLSFHIISQIGYLIAALGMLTRGALTAFIAFLIHYIFAKSALFLVSGATARVTRTYDLHQMGNLYRSQPLLAALFFIPALSLAGVPPFSGFFAKLAVIQAALRAEHWIIAGTAVVVGLLTLFSMMKIWREAFWKAPPENQPQEPARPLSLGDGVLGPCIAMTLFMVVLGLGAEPLLELADAAAGQLLDPEEYVRAVLGGRP